jgi:DNA-binding transcriptional LysR family regulator
MRLRHIEVFHAIKQTGSISRAAALLGVSQPAASKVLQHAESALGFKLFERVKGRLHPTAEAEVLHVEVAKLHRGLEQVRLLSANLRHDPEGRLRIGCLPSLGLSIIPPTIRAFRLAYPSVTCAVQTNHISTLLADLRARDLDLAVTMFPSEHPGITMQIVGEVDMVYLGPRPGPHEIDLLSIDSDELIAISRSDRMGALVADQFEQAGRPFRPGIEVETYFLACSLAAAGCGAAIVDALTARSMLRDGLYIRPLRIRLPIEIGILTHETHVGRRFYSEFARLLHQSVSAAECNVFGC